MIIRALQSTLLLVVFGSAIAFGQTGAATAANQVLLTVEGEVATPLKLTAADLTKLTHRSLTAKTHDGKQATFDGIELGDVLKLAGVKFGEQLRGKELCPFPRSGSCRWLSRRLRPARVRSRLH